MKNPFLAAPVLGTLLAVLVSGCSAQSGTQTPAAAPVPSVSPSCVLSCSTSAQADYTGPTAISWTAQAKKNALSVATTAMALYNRPTVNGTTWTVDLARYMTPKAGADYQGVDPANIPAFTVKSPGVLVIDPANGFGCHVRFSTTVGDYDFQLLRQGANQPWLLSRITPPAGIN